MVIFTISAQGARGLPKIMEIEATLIRLPEVPNIFVDTPPEHFCRLMHVLATPQFSTIIYRAPSRSPGSLSSFPRLRLELLLPPHTSGLEQTILLGYLKGVLGGSDILVGHKNLYGHQDALIGEINSPNAF